MGFGRGPLAGHELYEGGEVVARLHEVEELHVRGGRVRLQPLDRLSPNGGLGCGCSWFRSRWNKP